MSKIVFRFRVYFEDMEDVERIIDVKGENTFMEFHHAIQDAIDFDRIKKASFYKANDNWRASTEYSTHPENGAKHADNVRLQQAIDDPYQKFIYIYDETDGNWELRVEVIKLGREESGQEYPLLVKSKGNAPKQYKVNLQISDDPAEKLFGEADSLIKDLGNLLSMDDEDIEDDELDDEDLEDDEDDDEDEDEFGLYGEEIDESEL